MSQAASSIRGRKIIVAVTGGIACYKVCTLVSRLAQAGADVRVIMTESAAKFVGPLTFQSLSGQAVLTSMWQADDHPESQHIGLARWCDLLIIAPASANTIARIAHGLCDDIVSLTVNALPRDTPVLVAPAMNSDMWANPITQQNVQSLRGVLQYEFIGPDTGWQACRTKGPGRMSEPEAIFDAATALLAENG